MAEPRLLAQWLTEDGDILLIEFEDENQTPLLGFRVTDDSSEFAMGLTQAVELMEANISEPISQLELAGFVDLSRRQLQRLFQQHLLCTPSRYYLQLRLQRARELLRQTDLSLVESAAQTGFLSNSHFSKSYKEHYGYPPSGERRPKPADRSSQS